MARAPGKEKMAHYERDSWCDDIGRCESSNYYDSDSWCEEGWREYDLQAESYYGDDNYNYYKGDASWCCPEEQDDDYRKAVDAQPFPGATTSSSSQVDDDSYESYWKGEGEGEGEKSESSTLVGKGEGGAGCMVCGSKWRSTSDCPI
jgi:hypothetical protein